MTTGHWRTVAASATGATHAAKAAGNSDAFRIARYGPSGVAMVVADGLGSSAEGGFAARAAVTFAIQRLAGGLDEPLGERDVLDAQRDHTREAVADARHGIDILRALLQIPPRELGTTLLVCVASDAGVTFGGVGDGFLAVRAKDADGAHRCHLLTLEPPGRFANETSTLVPGCDIVVEAIVDPAIDGLAIATDGFEPAAVERPAAADRDLRAGVIDVLLRHADDAESSEGLHADVTGPSWDRWSDDDRTIVMAVSG